MRGRRQGIEQARPRQRAVIRGTRETGTDLAVKEKHGCRRGQLRKLPDWWSQVGGGCRCPSRLRCLQATRAGPAGDSHESRGLHKGPSGGPPLPKERCTEVNNAAAAFGSPGLPANLHLLLQEWAADLVDMVNPVVAPSFLVVMLLLAAGTAAADPQPEPEDNSHQGDGSGGRNGSDGVPGDHGDDDAQGDDEDDSGESPGDGSEPGPEGDANGTANATADGDASGAAQASTQDRLSCPVFRSQAGDPEAPVSRWIILDPNGCYNETIKRALGVPPVQIVLKRLNYLPWTT